MDRTLTYKLGVAFFCFGNIMLLSFQNILISMNFEIHTNLFSITYFHLITSCLYSASGYYVSAYKSIRTKMLNIDVPIALG
jgi:Cu+-exporting ATPase